MAAGLRVVDTSAWVEWLIGSQLGKRLRTEFPTPSHCIVPTIVQLELSKWLMRERGEEQADIMIAYTQKCVIVPLDTGIALLASEMHREYKLATADAIVYATARHQGAELLTCDAHFEQLPNVVYFNKE
ncbi:type II toxin-antitoxin system VapC family toxin [Hydrocarboniphaga sp.]|uniref:type II toxin-antitoxin system VapC family toxin n=1 Tax=Hydrocarboniphaga sp. TaxID=2033016 RepID=UPI003D0DE502